MAAVESCDVLVAVMGAPHASDMTTTLVRLLHGVADLGARVQVWTCGYATLLTQRSLGESKPRNLVDWSRRHPTTAAVVRDLLEHRAGQVTWYACRFCSEERGVAEHIPEVRVRPPLRFADHVASAGKTLFVGVV